MKNEQTERGWPVCPVCLEPIRPAESAARTGDWMVHIACLDGARQADGEPHASST